MSKSPAKKERSESSHTTQTTSTTSGGIQLEADKVNVGQDVIGRDQITRADEDVVEHDKITNVYYVDPAAHDVKDAERGRSVWLIPLIAVAVIALVSILIVSSLSNKQAANSLPTPLPLSALDLAHLKPKIDVTVFAAPETTATQLGNFPAGEEIAIAVQGRYDVGAVRWLVFRDPNRGEQLWVDSGAFGRQDDFQSLPIIVPPAAAPVATNSGDQSTPEPTVNSAQATAIQDANFYAGSDINTPSDVIPAGTIVTALGVAGDSPDSRWLCIQWDTVIGWAGFNNFNLSTNYTNLPSMSSCP